MNNVQLNEYKILLNINIEFYCYVIYKVDRELNQLLNIVSELKNNF